MSFVAPLGLLLAAAVPLVVLLHMRLRRTVHVPSLAIWRRIQLGQQKRSRKLGWPPLSWPLALQVLAVVVAAVALAQPALHGAKRIDHWVFLVDTSAPMNAQGSHGDLLDEAKLQLVQRLAGAQSGELVSIIVVGAEATPLVARQPAADDGVIAAINRIAPEDSRAAWDAAAHVVRAVLHPDETTAVITYSDVARSVDGLPDGVITEAVEVPPQSRTDASLTATLVPDPVEPFHYRLKGSALLEGGLGGTEVVVSYAADGTGSSLEWTRQTLGRLESILPAKPVVRPFDIPLELPGPGVISVSTSPDVNASGSTAWFVTSAEPTPVRILYIGVGQQPLLAAVAAVDGTTVYQAQGLPSDSATYDLVIVDNRRISRVPDTNVVWLGDAGVDADTITAGPALTPTAALTEHPLMAGVDWVDISVQQSVVAPNPGADILLSANGTPLITSAQRGAGRDIRILFDPRQSGWRLQSSLPAFAANIMQWLGLRAEGSVHAGCIVGDLCALDARYAGGTIERLDIPGAAKSLPVATFRPATAGLYLVASGDRSELLAINTSPAPRDRPAAVASESAPFLQDLWPWFVALVAVLLMIEAVVAGRGSERFLHLSALTRSSPLRNRRRLVLVLRGATLFLLLPAALNLPLLLPNWSTPSANLIAPGAATPAGPATTAGPQPTVASIVATPQRAGDMALAIRLAAATLPQGGRIDVGGQAALTGDAAAQLAQDLSDRGIAVAVAPNTDATAIAAADVELPSPLYAGDTFQLTGIVRAAAPTSATVTVARNGEVLVEQDVDLVAGDNRIDTLVPEVPAGTADYELKVLASDATAASSFHRIVDVHEPGKVAVIAADEGQGAVFADWLKTQGITAEPLLPIRAPYKLADWRAYDGAVLLDVPAIALTTQQQQELQHAVADEGLGLLILGGPNAFGPGGYLETPLDELSPLSSRVPRDMPEATLVFVLDRSGSMQQPVGSETRLDVAKQATQSAAQLLNAESQVGIVVFDAEATVVLPLQKLDADAVAAAMSKVDPGGGTEIYPGLEAAYEMLRGVDSPARHIVVMTDGLSQPADYPSLLARIRQEGITVSAVSIGKGAERELVAEIARLGDGTFQATDDFSALPSILSQEAMLLSGAPIETQHTQPLWASRAEPFLRGLPDTMPPIDGFVLTTPKPEATLSMAAPDSKGEAMPLLASWRYGNGSVLALATDAVGPWSAAWQQLPAYPALWSQALRQFLPPVDRSALALRLAATGDGVKATITVAEDAQPTLVATSAGESRSVPVDRIRPGLYEARFYPEAEGAVDFRVTSGEATATANWFANYPAHLRPPQGSDGLAALGAATAGNAPEGLRWQSWPAWPAWLVGAILLLLAELAIRYTGLIRPAQPVPPVSTGTPIHRRAKRPQPTPVAA